MYYTRLTVTCALEFSEILMAEVAEVGFDSFLETENGFEAYVENENFDAGRLSEVWQKYKRVDPLLFHQDRIEKKNWNEEWEKSLEPIVVEGKCIIRAEFHKSDQLYPYEIIITPKMSFGTGHHQTTYLMIKNQMMMDHAGKRVMDVGCGTGILSIMASKLGAREIEAFDIDEWSVINGMENKEINRAANIRIRQGRAADLSFTGAFDIVLANINRNVLHNELPLYAGYLGAGGKLLISGFYVSDLDALAGEALALGFGEVLRDDRETWASLLLQKE